MQHTPGPWRIVGNWPTYFLQSQNITDRANLWADICTLNMANGCGMTDARLISAAPDLLSALRKAFIALELVFYKAPELVTDDAYHAVSAAIAKATGLAEG